MIQATRIALALPAGFLRSATALAAPAGPAWTTAECNVQAAKIGTSAGVRAGSSTSENDKREDQFYWFNRISSKRLPSTVLTADL